jgi:tRNA(Ile)-lysidine synthase
MIEDTIRRFFAEEALAPRRVVAAVSGGFDSTALLIALAAMRDDFDLVAGHVNHHLRGSDSDDDEAFVRELCARMNITLRVADGTLSADEVKKSGVEAAAREVRMALLQEIRHAVTADLIATAHQKNDQAETIVMRLMTGGGVAALRGIHPVRDDGVIRPLLAVTRDDINTFLAERGIVARLDRSNADQRFLRNRVRAMLAECDASEIDNLASIATQARAQWRVLERSIDAAEDVIASERETIFRSLPDDAWLRQALLLRHIRRLDRQSRDVSSRDLERLASSTIKRQNVTKSIELLQQAGELILRRIEPAISESEVEMTIGVTPAGACPERSRRGWLARRPPVAEPERLRGTPPIQPPGSRRYEQLIALPPNAPPQFTVRNRRRGDRFQPLGMHQEVKLKDFFIARKVPREERDRIPLVVWNGEIVWIPGVEVSERFKIGPSDRDVYAVTIAPSSRAEADDTASRRGLQRR